MAGPIALVGGDESRTGCEGMDRAILEAMHVPSPTLLVIPMAGAGGNRSKAASNGVTYFIWHLGLLLNTGEWVSTRRTLHKRKRHNELHDSATLRLDQ